MRPGPGCGTALAAGVCFALLAGCATPLQAPQGLTEPQWTGGHWNACRGATMVVATDEERGTQSFIFRPEMGTVRAVGGAVDRDTLRCLFAVQAAGESGRVRKVVVTVTGQEEVQRGAELQYLVEVEDDHVRRRVAPAAAATSTPLNVELSARLDAGERRVPIAIRVAASASAPNAVAQLRIDRINVKLQR